MTTPSTQPFLLTTSQKSYPQIAVLAKTAPQVVALETSVLGALLLEKEAPKQAFVSKANSGV